MSIKVDTITAPAYWASAFINGDKSGMTDEEESAFDAYEARLAKKGWRVIDMVENSERFTWSYKAYGGDAQGGDVADYTVYRTISNNNID